MRRLLLATVLVMGLAGTSYAEGDWSPENIVKVCNGGSECIQQLMQMREYTIRQQEVEAGRQHERELARQQALGMAAFGSGNALINGMNQGFQGMRLPPYHQPGAQR